jgi:hypothetical protein
MMMKARLALAFLLTVPAALTAQRVSGTVRAAGGDAGLAGVVVTTVDSSGRTLGRTLTGENGRYSLAVTSSARRIRAVRIGFRPATMDLPRDAADATVDVTLERAPVILATVRVSSAQCDNGRDTQLASDLWEQARAALLAAIVARESNPSRVQLLEYQRRMDRVKRLITQQQLRGSSGVSSRPVSAARSGPMLAAAGYRASDRGDDVYFAPDADVLFDETFGETHCFGVTRGAREREGQIGLSFRPRRNQRDFVDVEGTLWLSSGATELLDLEYGYTGLDPEAKAAGAGGAMHFRTMKNGVVFIDEWSIIVPVMTEIRQRGFDGNPTSRAVVNDLAETGGYVLNAAWPDGTKWSSPFGGIRGYVGSASAEPMGGVAVTTSGASAITTESGAFSLPLPPGRYRLGLIDSTFAGYAEPRQQSREVVVSRNDTTRADFQVRSRESILADLCPGNRGSGTAILLGLIDELGQSVPDNLTVRTSWVSSISGTSDVDLDKLRAANQAARVNSSGRFHVCGIPANSSWITLRLESGRMPIADTMIAPNALDPRATGTTRSFEWTLRPGAFEAASRGDAASLRGRVTRNGQPMPNAEVWVVFADTTVRTDSAGRYRVGGLRAGMQMLEVRRIGFLPKRDTVLLKAREETVRDIVFDGVVQLDTMRTVGAGRAYIEPRLQDFEKRRLAHVTGHFVSEDDLRRSAATSIPNLIRTHIPGVRFVTYRGGTYAASFSSTNSAGTYALPPKGPSACWVSIWLNGVLIFERIPPQSLELPPDINQFLAMNLSGIEYYPSTLTAPMQFRTLQNACGSLIFWTRGR